jgi:diacylglycerol O-acyltransferase / wax synthase
MTTVEAFERASANDLMQLSFGSEAAATQIGAVLVLTPEQPLELDAVAAVLAERVPAVARLRQRLIRPPPGCGRPVWVDDPEFDVARHLREIVCPGPGDERQLLDIAATSVTTPLPADRPLWSVLLVRGLAGGRVGLVLTLHHVIADGIGGLAVLGQLVDGAPVAPASSSFPNAPPSPGRLAREAAGSRLRALRGFAAGFRRAVSGGRQLRPAMTGRAPRCALNVPTGRRRRLGVARADLAGLRSVARAHGGTVNDVVLTAVTGALHAYLLGGHGQAMEHLVVSVPVSGRTPEDRAGLANHVGVVPLMLPTTGAADARLTEIARITRVLRNGPRAATATVLAPVVRAAAALGIVRWYIHRQRRVNTFVTNLRGPVDEMRLCGATVTEVIAMNTMTGNVTVAFGALSYAGTLGITVVADPDHGPDVERLVVLLQRELDQLGRVGGDR